MKTLSRELRRQLENTVREARRIAEDGARKSIQQIAVGDAKPPVHLMGEQRALRTRLRAHARQLGDARNAKTEVQDTTRLKTECAYEHWHRMLFARFLAENNLLIEPKLGVSVSLSDCQELARESGDDWLELASRYAQAMLPEIFRSNDPVLELVLPREIRSVLEDLLKSLSSEVFHADDSLGWVYQFWQADSKEAVDLALKSGGKAGAQELPPKTQLFTEDYMVSFLLHNTLGAWWAGKVLASNQSVAVSETEEAVREACRAGKIEWTYLRFSREQVGDDVVAAWRPAAGTFDTWPKKAKDITLLDPCMGSGHFLVFALPILAEIRAIEEGLAEADAIHAVLRDNLYGLELDPRCTQIAAFNLALAAWRRIGYRELPTMHLACSGLSFGVGKNEWLKLAERASAELPAQPKRDLLGTTVNLFSDANRRGFERLYDLFIKAPTLGSLIQPASSGDLVESGFQDLQPLLAQVLSKAENVEISEMAVAAQGLTKAAEILSEKFTIVVTNVPYLVRGKQHDVLKEYCENEYPRARTDLATCFVERCLAFCAKGGSSALVTPQNWLFLSNYKHLRKHLLEEIEWNNVARLGEHGFESPHAAGAFTALLVFTRRTPAAAHRFAGFDVSTERSPRDKDLALRLQSSTVVVQAAQLANPDAVLAFDTIDSYNLLGRYCACFQGISTGDSDRLTLKFWELPAVGSRWRFLQSPPSVTTPYAGRECIADWETLDAGFEAAAIRGIEAWNRLGIAIGQMRSLPATLYTGEFFRDSTPVLIPKSDELLPAIWAFCCDTAFNEALRKQNPKVSVNNGYVGKIPFDLARWQAVAAEKLASGLPRPSSHDPTQWLFSGHPNGSVDSLQVAVARLVGYQWPRQTGSSFTDCPALGSDGLDVQACGDGIVALMPVQGEAPAAERLLSVLAAAYGAEWSAGKLASLLANVSFASDTLESWLRRGFFEQHCEMFHQRPFVWHIWDGRQDGFNVLVNYHRLCAGHGGGKRLLSKLIYHYLGDWIDRQRSDQKAGVEGADARLAAALHLKTELENILVGEAPYDLFVRWKPLHEQAIGWEPDINDGVRINIRPFVVAKPFNVRGKNTCLLATTPKIKWDKADRGKEPERAKGEFPWFWTWNPEDQNTRVNFSGGRDFDGNRWNDLHYTNEFKLAARKRQKEK